MKRQVSLLLSLILVMAFGMLTSLPQTYAETFIDKRNPSATEGEHAAFTDPELAYVSDNQRASANVMVPNVQTYLEFQFNLANIEQITAVSITIEGYAVNYDEELSFRAKAYNGSAWSSYKIYPMTGTEVNMTVDFTTALAWGEAQVNALQIYIYAEDLTKSCTVYVDQILATVQYESAHGAAGGPREDNWVPINLPNIPAYARRVLEWVQQMIREHEELRAVAGLGLIMIVGGMIIKWEKKGKRKLF